MFTILTNLKIKPHIGRHLHYGDYFKVWTLEFGLKLDAIFMIWISLKAELLIRQNFVGIFRG